MNPSPTVPEETNGDMTKQTATFPEGGDEQVEAEPQYTSESRDQDHDVLSTIQMSCSWFVGELHRISVCYGPGKGDEEAFTFSDDQSSCQVSAAPPSVSEQGEGLPGRTDPWGTVVLCLQDDCSEDGMLPEDTLHPDPAASKRVCRQ